MKYSAKYELLANDNLAEVAWEAIAPLWDDLPYSNAKKLAVFLSEVTVLITILFILFFQYKIANYSDH